MHLQPRFLLGSRFRLGFGSRLVTHGLLLPGQLRILHRILHRILGGGELLGGLDEAFQTGNGVRIAYQHEDGFFSTRVDVCPVCARSSRIADCLHNWKRPQRL
jgi:hypothetical protein